MSFHLFASWCFLLILQDILDEMRKELTKLKEELIDGEYLAPRRG